ncbi:MAG: hypothetical protein JXN10_04320 [Clostridia bacterium]|nr:hypothetical protein [Clostridia bacterium]MBN2882729.1 hypothetical protein [Clostridia bacterium]
MKYKRFCSAYVITVGLMMFLMWSFFLITGKVPELETNQAEIILHLTAEFSTALILILAGIFQLKNSRIAQFIYPLSIGMLLYTLIVSPGYYIQSKNYGFAAMFAGLIVLSVLALLLYTRRTNES